MQNPRLTLVFAVACLVVAAAAQQKAPSPSAAKPQPSGETAYRDSSYGFRYRAPFGWVDRTNEMQSSDPKAKGQVLLAVFERPPQAAGETVNSAVVVAAEPVETYPGLKQAEDYLQPLNELMTAKGMKAEGEATEVMIGPQRLVRMDFSKAISGKVVMHQSTLVMLKKGQVISFTFIGESGDEVDRLMEGLAFPASKSQKK